MTTLCNKASHGGGGGVVARPLWNQGNSKCRENAVSRQASAETEVTKSHASLLPAQISSESPGRHSVGATAPTLPIHKILKRIFTQFPLAFLQSLFFGYFMLRERRPLIESDLSGHRSSQKYSRWQRTLWTWCVGGSWTLRWWHPLLSPHTPWTPRAAQERAPSNSRR